MRWESVALGVNGCVNASSCGIQRVAGALQTRLYACQQMAPMLLPLSNPAHTYLGTDASPSVNCWRRRVAYGWQSSKYLVRGWPPVNGLQAECKIVGWPSRWQGQLSNPRQPWHRLRMLLLTSTSQLTLSGCGRST